MREFVPMLSPQSRLTDLFSRLFAASGYRVALIGRTSDLAKKLVDEINAAGGEAASFGSGDYNFQSTTAVWERVKSHRWASAQEPAPIRVALWNAAGWAFKPFLGHTEADLDAALEGNIKGAFAFSQQAILTFKENEVDEYGARGTLLFTGGTASWRSNPYTSALAIGKLGLRSLSLSLAQEFGKENIHVSRASGNEHVGRSYGLPQCTIGRSCYC